MINIYSTLYDIYHKIYTISDNSHVRLRDSIREFLYIRYNISIGPLDRCSIRTSIKGIRLLEDKLDIPVDIVFLNKDQTENWRGRKGYSSYNLMESYVGTYGTHLIIYVPDYMMYTSNDYEPMERLQDMVDCMEVLLSIYYRNNFILPRDKKIMCVYAPVTIALKVLFDNNICKVEDFEGKEIILSTGRVKLENLEEMSSYSLKDLLVNKCIEFYFTY